MVKEQVDYKARIVTDPTIMVGKPVVRGTRIPVEHVLGRLAENPDLGELFAAYPELTRDDVKACLQYAQHAVGWKWPRRSQGKKVTQAGIEVPLAVVGSWKGLMDAERLTQDLDAARSDTSPLVEL